MTKHYDADYFQRWYRDGDIGGAPRLARKVALAVAVAEYHLERPIRTVLDIGCGEGAWRAPLLKLRPKLQYLGFDSSEYAIRRFGRTRKPALRALRGLPVPAPLRTRRPAGVLGCPALRAHARTEARPYRTGGTMRRGGLPGDVRQGRRLRGL